MISKLAEWAGLMLLAVALARFFIMVTNTDSPEAWARTEEAERKAMRILCFREDA